MNNEESVTHEDDAKQSDNALQRWLEKPLRAPLTLLTIVFLALVLVHVLPTFKGPKLGTRESFTLLLITAGIFGACALALGGIYLWSHRRSYDVFCDWFYDNSRTWSYANLFVTLMFAASTFVVHNILLLNSVEDADKSFTISSANIPYHNAMLIGWHLLFSMVIFLLYFRIDRSVKITNSVDNWTAGSISLFALTPLVTGVANISKSLAYWISFGAALITAFSTFFIWTHISRSHIPPKAEEKKPRRSLRKQLPKYIASQWRMHRQIQRWRWDRRFPQRRERNVGMFT